jgi:hypothetical protein
MLIWGNHEDVYFCGEGWTGSITLKAIDKFASPDSLSCRLVSAHRGAPMSSARPGGSQKLEFAAGTTLRPPLSGSNTASLPTTQPLPSSLP